MAKLILNIDDELKQTYKEVLDKGLDNKSDRPYYALFRYNGYHVLVPIRSRALHSPYTLYLNNRVKGRNYGMDFCKMLILTSTEVDYHTMSGFVRSETMRDINAKRGAILTKINKTINDYKVMLGKEIRNEDLSVHEAYLKKRSTLVNFVDRI